MVESATDVCFLDAQAITEQFNTSTAPDTDFASEVSPDQSASEEDKALVQLARTYTERGSKVAWSEVAKKM
ncbi:uncharacterized protein PITG_19974 [Phytophthora infestans T30-4]|uniref:Uncharacterized protein n=1 Tax=Phytophthora infestans (strain T30-4) TaxID=403677 RepID=D0P1N1_PHYIT|nr:uncharacterized protein PITG_19974 [Phytophthora infestans T30-4]EEY54663.1 conserved hypothetical protein [Phytophthora infestans T30-4]|eukprot:XP_002895804.1 conserved hypothetical protein [Phytophthora infestans T30-4]